MGLWHKPDVMKIDYQKLTRLATCDMIAKREIGFLRRSRGAGGDTHHKKRSVRNKPQNMTRGRTPIEKNVIVVDERGNEYEATYPKRAKGLVKKGRARFIGENKICLLARPPNVILEDDSMNEYTLPPEPPKMISNNTETTQVADILARIDRIISDTAHIQKALDTLTEMPVQGGHDIGAANKAEAIARIVEVRETTNQQLLDFLERMYNDRKPYQDSDEIIKFKAAIDAMQNFPSLDEETVSELIDTLIYKLFAQPSVTDQDPSGAGFNWNRYQPNAKTGSKPPRPFPPWGRKKGVAGPAAPDAEAFNVAEILRSIADQMSGSGGNRTGQNGTNAQPKDKDTDKD